ncbi:bacterio-opsin activator domain-containing protein [Halospeciosus flavus]|nr:bacterio-opsin activator domain-containing protein [Halospeciosus flavus]
MLLIEDNPGDARYIQELLEEAVALSERSLQRQGGLLERRGGTAAADDTTFVHETRLADGLEQMDAMDPDVVLLDLNLPDSTGLDTLQTVVDHDRFVPIVVLTGLQDRQVGIEALRQGAEEYLVKDEINPDLLVRSVYHAIERKAHEREQQRYETLIEESTDANAILNQDGTVEYVTPSTEHVLGYSPDELVGESVFDYIHPEDHADVRREFDALVTDPDRRSESEFRFKHRDGSWIVLHARGRNLLDDSAIDGLVVYTRDVTERRERERQLEQQRRQLAALNQLNGVVHGVTEAVIDRSTRQEIEQTACDRLAESDSYAFAWVGEPDSRSQTLTVRAASGDEPDLDDVTVPTDGDESRPSARALQTQAVQTMHDAPVSPVTESRDGERAPEFASGAAIPIVHEDTVYGVLTVYATREGAFRDEERSVVSHLGEILGHAIAAAERKRALLGDTQVELDFEIRNLVDSFDGAGSFDEAITLDRTVPVSDDEFLVYGTASESEIESLRAMVEEITSWETLDVVSEQLEGVRFELRISDAPIMSEVASLGGSIEYVVVEANDLQMTVRLPQDVEVRQVVETIHERYPQAEAVARRQVSEEEDPSEQIQRVWTDELTDRQRTVVETAYFSGFFEWPRDTTGGEVAESLGISTPTFSEHLRSAEKKLFAGILDEPAE